jgi:hypothetical protein
MFSYYFIHLEWILRCEVYLWDIFRIFRKCLNVFQLRKKKNLHQYKYENYECNIDANFFFILQEILQFVRVFWKYSVYITFAVKLHFVSESSS